MSERNLTDMTGAAHSIELLLAGTELEYRYSHAGAARAAGVKVPSALLASSNHPVVDLLLPLAVPGSWEHGFLTSLGDQMSAGRKRLTPNQTFKLIEVFHRMTYVEEGDGRA